MKCNICEKEVEVKTKVKGAPDHWSINSNIISHASWDVEILKGCEVCLKNVDQLVVLPNRAREAKYEKKRV
jgi:hypothetical protein|tara:strand:- start:1893 stop:2105 length:213 start_codon:yes stop_codon:yes gene_type:complete